MSDTPRDERVRAAEGGLLAHLLERWDASPPIIWTGYGPDEVRSMIDYWRPLERAAGQRLDAGRSPADTARDLESYRATDG